MPTTIDIQNAKQIRQPMDVLITMELEDDTTTLSFSGYSSAKVADGALGEPDWSMRKLADLQGDGFPLDGTHQFYNPSTQPSKSAGKIGVRSNIGETVSVTVSASKTVASLTVFATGAESVTYNGTTTKFINGQVVIPMGSTLMTLTFNPSNETTRIEVSEISPGTKFIITNENLIRATVSLRSDLSLFDQTLPESEINIEAYQDADISDAVAAIPADTPITYQAGYTGDMSAERKFYVSGQVTWADNVLRIQGVDAVHFLDNVNIVAPVTEEDSDYFFNSVRYVLEKAGINADDNWSTGWWSGAYRWIIPENTNARSLLAFLNQCFNLTDKNENLIDGSGKLSAELRFAYVDAGIPALYTRHKSRSKLIYENDCADVKKNIEPAVGTVTTTWKRLASDEMDDREGTIAKVGSATLTKNIGTSLTFDEYTYTWQIGLFAGRNYDNDIANKMLNKYGIFWGYGYLLNVVPGSSIGAEFGNAEQLYTPGKVGDKLAKGEIPQSDFNSEPAEDPVVSFSSFVPWAQSYDGWRYDDYSSHKINNATQMWNVLRNAGIVNATAESLDLDIYGWAFYTDPQAETYAVNPAGKTYDYGEAPIIGRIAAVASDGSDLEIYPEKMLTAGMHRSNVTGSFTWKGDPRMQPRDVVGWERLDGTLEEITLENITLIHEGGGLTSEITFRKGDI